MKTVFPLALLAPLFHARRPGLWLAGTILFLPLAALTSCTTLPLDRLVDSDGFVTVGTHLTESEGVNSPDGQWMLQCPEENDPAALRSVILRENGSGQERVLYEFLREATAIWSPDSKAVLLTDEPSGNESTCLLLFVKEDQPPVDLGAALSDVLTHSRWSDFAVTDKWYLQGAQWRGPQKVDLVLECWRNAEEAWQDRLFYVSYTLGDGFHGLKLVRGIDLSHEGDSVPP